MSNKIVYGIIVLAFISLCGIIFSSLKEPAEPPTSSAVGKPAEGSAEKTSPQERQYRFEKGTGLLIQETLPDGKNRQWTYDIEKRVVDYYGPDKERIVVVYDQAGKPTVALTDGKRITGENAEAALASIQPPEVQK